jgi:hypothetical protein
MKGFTEESGEDDGGGRPPDLIRGVEQDIRDAQGSPVGLQASVEHAEDPIGLVVLGERERYANTRSATPANGGRVLSRSP